MTESPHAGVALLFCLDCERQTTSRGSCPSCASSSLIPIGMVYDFSGPPASPADGFRPLRGCLFGLLAGTALWAAILAAAVSLL